MMHLLKESHRDRKVIRVMRWLAPCSVRVTATSDDADVAPLAFVGPGKGSVVVMKARRPVRITISGLAAGTYGVRYTTDTETHAAQPDVTARKGSVALTMPGAGVVTVSRRMAD